MPKWDDDRELGRERDSYREGKALGVDRGDDMIRDRVAFKLQLLIFDQIRVPQPTEDQLRAWFADNHGRFDEQERVGFYLTPPTDEMTAQRQLAEIEGQHEAEDLQKQTRAILGRPSQAWPHPLAKASATRCWRCRWDNGKCFSPRMAGTSFDWIPGAQACLPVSTTCGTKPSDSG